ncbi:hypothetical protein LARV_02680 [Longilinea arvoryzae]|uniref:Uncharacterized protein n=1 Tax=Longilinea arvoryzae TaxID=360412 RepID=A0A0S7BM78_9CHLR|nr:hypothetical protein [Longilinea arvoryzae]GAP14901.1 hypothetical protein LARV_02680 [Longilinea arvoryzae]
MTPEQWDLIISVLTVLITGGTLILYLRDRMEICQIRLTRGVSTASVSNGAGGRRSYEVPGFEIVIRNRGKTSIYVSSVYLRGKQSKEKVSCSFGVIPMRASPNAPVTAFSKRYSFEIDSGRSVKSDFPAYNAIGELKLQDQEKASLFVVVELESGKLIRSRSLTIRPKEVEAAPPPEERTK